MKSEQFNKICRYCKKEIFPDRGSGIWRTKKVNEWGWVNACTDYYRYNSTMHKPFTNLEFLEMRYEQKLNRK